MITSSEAVGSPIDLLQAKATEVESDREFKAHIYQQLAELQPLLTPESEVSILIQVEREEPAGAIEYALSLITTLGEYRLEAEGRGGDLYSALAASKQNLLLQLDEIYGSVIDFTEREAEINSLLKGGSTLH